MYDICTIGHITLDKVVTPKTEKHMPGGTSFYFSKALQHFPIKYKLITALAPAEQYIIDGLTADGIEIYSLPSPHTVYFENIYTGNQDHREQNVSQKASPFLIAEMPEIAARIYHLGPLLNDDIPTGLIKKLAGKGMVSLDIQGYLRYVENGKVKHSDWLDKREALPFISILKANEFEMEAVTGTQDPAEGARQLAGWGVREVIITLGSGGSLIYSDGVFYEIPAYPPAQIVDATGCGDTYMAGYLYQKTKGADIEQAGNFGAAMATLKLESSGPFAGTEQMVEAVLAR